MTGTFEDVRLEPLNEGPDLGRPLGQWEAAAVLIGDASGGTVTLTLALDKRYVWSLEGWMANETAVATGGFQLTWTPVLGFVQQSWVYVADVLIGSTTRAIGPADQRVRLPVTGRSKSSGTPGDNVVVTALDNANLQIYRANVWGYYWDKRAASFPGGLMRPL